MERIKQFILHFRIIPTLNTNPVTGSIDVSFNPSSNQDSLLIEDVLGLIENLATQEQRMIIILDEFQEILDIAPNLDKLLRSIMQLQKNVNYVLLGSQESMMTDIFEKKKSPFYHFGQLMRLKKLPRKEFYEYIHSRLIEVIPTQTDVITEQILDYTDCHPYYSQQLASQIWQESLFNKDNKEIFQTAVNSIVENHSMDFERLWLTFNRTDKWIMLRLAEGLSVQTGEYKTSTIYSALKKMQRDGYIIYTDKYEIEDPFYKEWILKNIV